MQYGSNEREKTRMPDRLLDAACLPMTLAAVCTSVFLLFSCTGTLADPDDNYLIRVGEQVVTVRDFNQAFDIVKNAYSHDFPQNPVLFQEAQVRMSNQMIEELLVLQRAAELGIDLTESELPRAIADIKADYPEGVFEKMLLKHAVSYGFWEKRVKTRLIMEKVVEREVYQHIVLTPEEIAGFYKEYYKEKHPVLQKDAETTPINELIVKQLRRQKAEEAYHLWMTALKEKYAVDINQSQWRRLTGL